MPDPDTKSIRLPFGELVQWLREQPDTWWSVDGDPLVTSRVSFPCPADELAAEIERIGKDLVLLLPEGVDTPDSDHLSEGLGKIAEISAGSDENRMLELAWQNGDITPWFLLEDRQTAASSTVA